MSDGGFDLVVLRDRVSAVLPHLVCEMVELEHVETKACIPALAIETPEPRKKDHVYRMTVTTIDGEVNFFVHVHGTSKDLTTRGTQHFAKAGASLDEVVAIVRCCWTGGLPS